MVGLEDDHGRISRRFENGVNHLKKLAARVLEFRKVLLVAGLVYRTDKIAALVKDSWEMVC